MIMENWSYFHESLGLISNVKEKKVNIFNVAAFFLETFELHYDLCVLFL